MSLLRAGIRMRPSLLGDQLRRGLIGRDLFAVAATLADAVGEVWAVLTLDHQADPSESDIVLIAQTSAVARVDVDPALIVEEGSTPYDYVVLEV